MLNNTNTDNMSEEYQCTRCGYHTADITNFRRHLTRKAVCEPKLADVDISTLQQEHLAEKKVKSHICDCGKAYASRSGLFLHKKKCSVITPPVPERLEHGLDIEKLKEELKESIKKELMQEIASTSNDIVINHTTNHNHNNNLVINVNNFGTETYDHITPEFIKTCILNNTPGMKTLIERIHFSDDAPHNKNIRHKSFKNQLVEVMKDNKWVIKDAHETADTLIKKGCRIMSRHYFEDEQMQDTDLNEYDRRIQNSLLHMNDKTNPQYFSCRKRILALIAEYSA